MKKLNKKMIKIMNAKCTLKGTITWHCIIYFIGEEITKNITTLLPVGFPTISC